MSELLWVILALAFLLALDLVAVAIRAAFLETSQARMLALREQSGSRASKAVDLVHNPMHLRASLNLSLVLTRFLLAGLAMLLIVRMDDEDLRWTVRVFADCLSPRQRAECRGSYDERWPVETRRPFVAGFIRRYTQLALDALERAKGAPADDLAGLTDEDLQGMSLAEKWLRLAKDPEGLRPDQLRRELARLFMCKSYDLFHDAGLSEAAVEYPAYHRAREDGT